MDEIWKNINGYYNIYQISNYGRIKSCEKIIKHWRGGYSVRMEKILKPSIKRRYQSVTLTNNKSVKKSHSVHKLVAEAFIGKRPVDKNNTIVIDHIDGDTSNNCSSNLRYITNRLNTVRAIKGGTSKYTGVSWHKGIKKWHAQITINNKKKHIGFFSSQLEASKAYQEVLQAL